MGRLLALSVAAVTLAALAGCSTGSAQPPAGHHSGAPASAESSASADDSALPDGVPMPPKASDYDQKSAAGKAKYLKALKAWRAALTPAQAAEISDSLGFEEDPQEKAELDWFTSLEPGIQKACIQLPIVGLVLASLAVPGSSVSQPKEINTYAKSLEEIRDLQVKTDLRDILDSMATELRRHAHDTPPINDPILEKDATQMAAWIKTNCTMPAN